MPAAAPLRERLCRRIVFDASGCWLWTGALNASGYGVVGVGSGARRVHRVTYEMLIGPVPDGLQLDHLCRNRACANPLHLEPVTSAENTRRGNAGLRDRVKTHCPKGHPYTPENTRLTKKGSRVCRTCAAAAVRTHREKQQKNVATWRLIP